MRTDRQRVAALDQVLELTVLLSDDMTKALAALGLTNARVRLLWRLAVTGPTTQRGIADALAVTPRNVTGLVDGLAATGFVTRRAHPTDRRAALVSLTAHGEATARRLAEARHQLAEQMFATMPDRQFDGLVDGLGALLGRLRSELDKNKNQATVDASDEVEDGRS